MLYYLFKKIFEINMEIFIKALLGGKNTGEMKKRLGVPDNRPLADFLPTIIIKAKDFATEITVYNTKEKGLNSESSFS